MADAESRPSNMDSESAGLADCSTQEDISNTGKKKDFVKRNKEVGKVFDANNAMCLFDVVLSEFI